MKARFYDPDSARFLTQDTYLGVGTEAPSLHRYMYAYSNPTVYFDPDGYASVGFSDDREIKAAQKELCHGSYSEACFGRVALQVEDERKAQAKAKQDAQTKEQKQRAFDNWCRDYGGDNCSTYEYDKWKALQADKRMLDAQRTAEAENLAAAYDSCVGSEVEDDCRYKRDMVRYTKYVEVAAPVIEILTPGRSGSKGGKIKRAADSLNDLAQDAAKAKKVKRKLTGEADSSEALGPNCAPCPSCFVAGTLVQTKDGLKPIEEIQEGELVASRDEATGEIAWKPVTTLFQYDDDRTTYELLLQNHAGDIERFEVTDNHPFWVENIGWVDSVDLVAGMRVPSYAGDLLEVVSLVALERSPVTYNFEVADYHTYFVGESGAWVHNQNRGCGCEITITPKGEWSARQLEEARRKGLALKKLAQDGQLRKALDTPKRIETSKYRKALIDRINSMYANDPDKRREMLRRIRTMQVDHIQELQLSGLDIRAPLKIARIRVN